MLKLVQTQFEKTSMIIDVNTKKLGLTSSQKLILICLSNYLDGENTCFPSLTTISNKSGLSTRTVSRAIIKLESLKYLKVSKKYSERTKHLHNLYILNVPLLLKLATKSNVVNIMPTP